MHHSETSDSSIEQSCQDAQGSSDGFLKNCTRLLSGHCQIFASAYKLSLLVFLFFPKENALEMWNFVPVDLW